MRGKATRTLVAGLAIAVAIAGAVLAAPDPDRATAWSPVVYPMQRLPLTFSHAQHLGL